MLLQAFRFKLLGNAVSVPVAHWLGQRLAAPYHAKYVVGAKDAPFEPAAAQDPAVPGMRPDPSQGHMTDPALQSRAQVFGSRV